MDNNLFVELDYNGVLDFFASLKTGLIYIGGSWCKTCENVMDKLTCIAKNMGLNEIYHYDPRFVNVYGEVEDLRDCKSLEIKMDYYKLVEKLGFTSNELVKNTLIPRIHLPFFAAVKFGRCVKYYSKELFKEEDGKLHTIDCEDDCSDEFCDNIKELIEIVKIDDTLLL